MKPMTEFQADHPPSVRLPCHRCRARIPAIKISYDAHFLCFRRVAAEDHLMQIPLR